MLEKLHRFFFFWQYKRASELFKSGHSFGGFGTIGGKPVTSEMIEEGVRREWMRLNCRKYQHEELTKQLNLMFRDSKSTSSEHIECHCKFCKDR